MSVATKVVAASSEMLPLVTAQIVGFEPGIGGRISRWQARLWPLEVECEIPDDRYIIVFGVHIEEPVTTQRSILDTGKAAGSA